MQCNQPYIATSPPNCPQYFPCPNPGYQPCSSSYPDVVGEGEITTLALPDGTVQHFFLPTSRWTPYTSNPNSFWNPTAGVWFIRSSSQYPLYCQQPSLPCGAPRIGFGCNSHIALPPPRGFEVKFHNDGRTSTTDLQYFVPRPCPRTIISQSCAGVQVTTPDCSCKCEVVRDSQCACTSDCAGSCKTSKKSKENVVCECYKDCKKTGRKDSCMSIDCTKKLKAEKKKRKDTQCQYSTSDSSVDKCNKRGRKSKSKHYCDSSCSTTSTSLSDCSTSAKSREKKRKAQEKAWKKQEKLFRKREKEKERKRKQECKKAKAKKKPKKLSCSSQSDVSLTCSLCDSSFDSKGTSTPSSRSCLYDDPNFCSLQKERYQEQLKSEKKLMKLLEKERKKIEKDRRKQEKDIKKCTKRTKKSLAKMKINSDSDLCNCTSITNIMNKIDDLQSVMSVDAVCTDLKCSTGCQLLNIYEGTTKDFCSEVCTCQSTSNKISATYSEQASGGVVQCIFPTDLPCNNILDDSDFVY